MSNSPDGELTGTENIGARSRSSSESAMRVRGMASPQTSEFSDQPR